MVSAGISVWIFCTKEKEEKSRLQAPLTFSQIQALAGVGRAGVSQVITTLSLHYPLYEAARGLYKLYGDDDYGDGINRAALKEYEDEWWKKEKIQAALVSYIWYGLRKNS